MNRLKLLFATSFLFCSINDMSSADDDQESLKFFEQKIRPVLIKECYSCHSQEADEIEGGLALDNRAGIRKGGDLGPAVVPGSLRKSLLIEAIRHSNDDLKMPPEKKLPPEVIADFEKWVRAGATDPRDGQAAKSDKYEIDIEKGREHWAFKQPVLPTIPTVKNESWPSNEIDRFVLDKLEAKGLAPVSDADQRTLFRRLHFDLTGLPPTEEDIEKFVSDSSPDAYSAAVDRLLESSSFGEKWAKHWLDVARFAESTGGSVNFFYPNAWRYRDYVIDAFNNDKPYDLFVQEQLAGDLMPTDDPVEKAERIIATGFLAMGTKTLNERSGLKHELDVADEQIDVTTQAFLGITAACARCHDHKLDPIPQTDYYALAGIFRSTETYYGTVRFINAQRPSRLLSLPEEANAKSALPELTEKERERIEGQIESVQERVREMKDPIQRFLVSGRISLLEAQLDRYDRKGVPKRQAMGVRDKRYGSRGRFGRSFAFGQGANRFTFDGSRTIADSPVFVRGEHDSPEDKTVPRGTLQVLVKDPLEISRRSSGRRELAEWIASPENPLTARVMVNRVWQNLFGRGLVPTSNDFGQAGRPPSHPELLDYLAIRFVENGWSVKQLIKLMVTSHVYRLSSISDQQALQVDPDNVLLWRNTPRRLSAESLRDAMLAVSGQLKKDPPVGSAVAKQSEGPVNTFGISSISRSINDANNVHRSIYLPVVRDNLPEAMALFDAADPSLIASGRQQTTVPAQGLFILNNEFVLRASDATAKALMKIEDQEQRIQTAFSRLFGRPPTQDEIAKSEKFLDSYSNGNSSSSRSSRSRGFGSRSSRSGRGTTETDKWSAFCQALFATAEFQFRK